MSENFVADAAKQTVTSVRTFLVGQIDTQIDGLGQQLHATSASIKALADHTREDPNVAPGALLVEQAGSAIERAATYFKDLKAADLLADVESYSRRQPLVATLGASIVGFAISRALKASSTRRFNDGAV